MCQQNWNLGIGASAKNLAKEFAKHNRVLYVNMPLDINNLLRGYAQPETRHKIRVLLGQEAGLIQVEKNIWVYTPDILCLSVNWVRSKSLFTSLSRFSGQLLARSIRKAIRKLDFSTYHLFQDGIIFQAMDLPKYLNPKKSIYYLRDYTITVPYFRRHGPWVEAKLMRQADVVATNTDYATDYARLHNPHHSYSVGQGCVLELHQPHRNQLAPSDLAAVPQPIIGYAGVLTTLRLNLDLLLAIAKRRPDWSLVLVGPEDNNFKKSLLHELPNVYFLGQKQPEEIPSYLNHFAVCINPQLVNEITIGNYPLKIDEYLAMGKPVVATHTQGMNLFKDYVYLANNENEWLDCIAQALHEPFETSIEANRIAFAQSHSWAASVELIYKAIESVD